ncbi:phenylalanine--tRNA ligase beta subunit-related protein [Candidatus Bipolaricaulota bacterium]
MMTSESYQLELDTGLAPCPAVFGLIWAEGIRPPAMTSSPPEFLQPLLTAAIDTGEEYVPLEVRQRVRKVLRYGKYKPSGRSKPASEFLLRAALSESFPLVNAPVDVNNAMSLESGFPGSIFDADISGRHLLIRRGHPDEEYVFNPSGQTIDLQDLLLVCRKTDAGWVACGNPVKDGMTTKISIDTTAVIAVLYAPIDEPVSSVEHWSRKYAATLAEHCDASDSGYKVIAPNDAV